MYATWQEIVMFVMVQALLILWVNGRIEELNWPASPTLLRNLLQKFEQNDFHWILTVRPYCERVGTLLTLTIQDGSSPNVSVSHAGDLYTICVFDPMLPEPLYSASGRIDQHDICAADIIRYIMYNADVRQADNMAA